MAEINDWKRGMLELPDELFFSIMRVYLGELHTPFHKPALVDRIISFLSQEETLTRICSLLEDEDTILLTAVDLLEGAKVTELYEIFEEEMDYFSFYGRIRNLQERLLIYQRGSDEGLVLTPFLKTELRKRILSRSILFERRESDEAEKRMETVAPSPVSETLLWNILAFLHIEDRPLKRNGELKKRSLDHLVQVFPGVHAEGGAAHLFDIPIRLGLVEKRKDTLLLQHGEIDRFSHLERSERLCRIWAAACMPPEETGTHPILKKLSPALISRRAGLIRSLIEELEPENRYGERGLRRFLRIESLRIGGTVPAHGPSPIELQEAGILERHGEDCSLSPKILEYLNTSENSPSLMLQPDFSVTVSPPVPFSIGILIGELFDIRGFDVYPRFELTKESFTRARSSRLSYEELTEFIERASGRDIPHNVGMTLHTWEQAFSGIALFEGIILKVDEERMHLVEHSPALQPYLLHSFGRGLYLLDPDSTDVWRSILEKSGIDPLPPIRRARERKPKVSPPLRLEEEPDIYLTPQPRYQRDVSPQEKSACSVRGEELKEKLRSTMEKQKLSEKSRRVIDSYIEHKLILFPEQVGAHLIEDELTEARGLDYTGKVRIIEESVSKNFELLEIVLRMQAGKPKRMLLRPQKLERGERELYLHGFRLPHGEAEKIPVGKISYVKRWKNSLFIGMEEGSRR